MPMTGRYAGDGATTAIDRAITGRHTSRTGDLSTVVVAYARQSFSISQIERRNFGLNSRNGDGNVGGHTHQHTR